MDSHKTPEEVHFVTKKNCSVHFNNRSLYLPPNYL